MPVTQLNESTRALPAKRIYPQAVMSYTFDGVTHTRSIMLEVGSMIDMIRTLKWCYHRDLPVTIEWAPDHEESRNVG